MKKLLTLAALALSLGLSSQSFADSNVFGVQTPIDRKEVKDNVYSGYVAKNLQDGFHVQKLQNQHSAITKIDNDKENDRGFKPTMHDKYSFQWYGKI